jgi:biotin operon repressor
MRVVWSAVLVLSFAAAGLAQGAPAASPWDGVAQALGRAGTLQGGVYKVGFPRRDLAVTVGSTKVETALALGGWAAFRMDGNDAITDGDLVLTADEVNPVISALEKNGLDVTAVHNHLLGETPRVMYVHFFGRGDAVRLAQGVRAALAETKTPMGAAPATKPSPLGFDQKQIESMLGKPGTANGAVLSFGFARPHPIAMRGVELPPAMGMATGINFQASARGVAATGDFVLDANQVNAVIKALRAGGVEVTAVHNHLLEGEPETVFIHFWAEGPAERVAGALRQALDAAK